MLKVKDIPRPVEHTQIYTVEDLLITFRDDINHDSSKMSLQRKMIADVISSYDLDKNDVIKLVMAISQINLELNTPDFPIDNLTHAERYNLQEDTYPSLEIVNLIGKDIVLAEDALEQIKVWKQATTNYHLDKYTRFYEVKNNGKALLHKYVNAQRNRLSSNLINSEIGEAPHLFKLSELTDYLNTHGIPVSQFKREPSAIWYLKNATNKYVVSGVKTGLYVTNAVKTRLYARKNIQELTLDQDDFFNIFIPTVHKTQVGINQEGETEYKGTMFWNDEKDVLPGKYFDREEKDIVETRIIPEVDKIRSFIFYKLYNLPPNHYLAGTSYASFKDHHYSNIRFVSEMSKEKISELAKIKPDYANYQETCLQVAIERSRLSLLAAIKSENKQEISDYLADFIQEMVHLHPFFNVNYSITMNIVNTVLEMKFGKVIPNGYLDYFSFGGSNRVFRAIFNYYLEEFSFDIYNPFDVDIVSMKHKLLMMKADDDEKNMLKEFIVNYNPIK